MEDLTCQVDNIDDEEVEWEKHDGENEYVMEI
jgi:hypothetical protein